jgi:ASC-1-like (ASCH) protein
MKSKMEKIKQLRFRKIDKDIFEAVKNGKKEVETRAASPKFRNIKAGDTVILKCGSEKIERKVKKATIFKSIKEMIMKYKVCKIIPGLNSLAQLEKVCYSFSDYREKIKKYGVIAIEI